MVRPPQISTLFPYATLFRSGDEEAGGLHRLFVVRCIEAEAVDGLYAHLLADQQSDLLLRVGRDGDRLRHPIELDRKSTRLNSSHGYISYAVVCLKKKIPPNT